MRTIVILGCGFGGVDTAIRLKRLLGNSAEIVCIDKNPYFTYTPSIHEYFSDKVRLERITIGLRELFEKRGIKFLNCEVRGVDVKKKEVFINGEKIKYDYLVFGLGSVTNYYDISGLREYAFELKGLDDSLALREHIEEIFSNLWLIKEPGERRRALSFVIGGGGYTGVELCMELYDFLGVLCRRYKVDIHECTLSLVEATPHVLPRFAERVVGFVEGRLKKLGFNLYLGSAILRAEKYRVELVDKRVIEANTIIWTGGIKANGIVFDCGLSNERGALKVNSYLHSVMDERVYGVGDNIYYFDERLNMAELTNAQNALRHAKVVSRNIYLDINKRKKVEYRGKRGGTLISMGRGMGVFSYRGFMLAGFFVAVMKKFVERFYLFCRRRFIATTILEEII